jgi:predicted metalloprotease with PDZ domain
MCKRPAASLVLLAASALTAGAQHPLRHFTDGMELRFARGQPVVHYVLRVDATDLQTVAVEMRVRNAPDTFRVAMHRHPEYDDRFWRFVEGMAGEGAGRPLAMVREDSALWRVAAPGGEAVIRYRIRLPAPEPPPRASWRPVLTPAGGLIDGTHALMYVVGATLAPSHLTVELPPSWSIATALDPTSDPRTFFAPSVHALMEAPLVVGSFRSWRFAIDGVPHRVVYWPLPGAPAFDTTAFVGGIERVTRQAVALFGRAPWREYVFLIQDGAFGALEHPSSVTVGAPAASLAEDPHAVLPEIAHELFHAWNLMRIRPAEYGDVDYRAQTPSAGLWFSEGMSMLYSDLLRRRAGVPMRDSTRIGHLEGLIARYLNMPGNTRFSAERVSRVAYGGQPGTLGDYESASTHLQGEVLGTMLDLIVRDATANRRSLDDVMRLMLERYSGEQGFTGRDIERAVRDVCGCDVRPFFERHVRGAAPVDFDRYLALAGLRARITRGPSLGRDGRPVPDLRLFSWVPPGRSHPALLLSDPESVWGRAGLHTGDDVAAIDGVPMATQRDLRVALGRARIGDTLRVDLAAPRGPRRVTVVVAGYDRPFVTIEEVPSASEKQRAIRKAWQEGK